MAAYYNEENGTAVKLTEDEQKRLQKYISQHAAVKDIQRNAAQKGMARQMDRVTSTMNRRYNAEIQALHREIDRSNAQLSAAIRERIARANPKDSAELQKYIREELNKEIKKRMALINNGGGSDLNKLNAEIKSMKNLLARANNANSNYRRDLKRLQEADRKFSKQLKNSKSKNALEQAAKTHNSFGEGASGK